jgi:S-adenosylhomocysteine hydrolase
MYVMNAHVLSNKRDMCVTLRASNDAEKPVIRDKASKVRVKLGTTVSVLGDGAVVSIVVPRGIYSETDPRKFGNQMLNTFKKALKL